MRPRDLVLIGPVLLLAAAGRSQPSPLVVPDLTSGDLFGMSVAASGDIAMVGAPGRQAIAGGEGSVFIFARSATGWELCSTLPPPPGAERFGYTIAISNDVAVVSAPFEDIGVNIDQGAAYIFVRTPSGWVQRFKLVAADGAARDYFGYRSVAASGDTVVIGAPGSNSNRGAAYVFVRFGEDWPQQAKLSVADNGTEGSFGNTVAVCGDCTVVGSHLDDVGANVNQGSAYVFVRSGTTWVQQAKLVAADGSANDHFGHSVTLSGDTAVVGALYDRVGSNDDQGSAYVFVRSGLSWGVQAKLIASDGRGGASFGSSVAISNDAVLVGAYTDDIGTNYDQGSAYLFSRSGSSWTEQAKWYDPIGAIGDQFGRSVSLCASDAIVSALGQGNYRGAAWAYQVGNIPPGSFSLLSPTSGATDVEINPRLIWSSSSFAEVYTVAIDTEADFVPPHVYTVATDLTYADVPAAVLSYQTVYYWRVEASNPVASVATGTFAFTTTAPACVGDVNADSVVNSADLSFLLGVFGTKVAQFPSASPADLNADGMIDAADLSILLSAFGEECG